MMIKEYMYHPSRQSLEYGRAESKRYGLSMPPHMIGKRYTFYMCAYRISSKIFNLTAIVNGTCEPTCM